MSAAEDDAQKNQRQSWQKQSNVKGLPEGAISQGREDDGNRVCDRDDGGYIWEAKLDRKMWPVPILT